MIASYLATFGHGLLLAGVALSGSIHAAAYLCLLAVFGLSLLPGREPMVSRFARFTRGELPPDLVPYTRQVTKAWCVFFMVQLAGSVLLLTFATLQHWAIFTAFMNLPLILLMLVGEYLYRLRRFPNHRHESLADMVRLWRHVRVGRS